MKTFLKPLLLSAFLLYSCATGYNQNASDPEPRGTNNLAYKWGRVTLEATANDTEWFNPRPTVTSRFLGLVWTAVYDAWSRYDDSASPLYLQSVERRPAAERTLENKEAAISYAAFRTLMEYF